MKIRCLVLAFLSICLTAFTSPADSHEDDLSPAVADTFCRDTSVCVKGNPFNLNLLCSPAGGIYYGSPAVLGDQFNPVIATIGANLVLHGFLSGTDTVLMCSFTITVGDTVYPGGPITGNASVCKWTNAVYTIDPVPNATGYSWSFSGSALSDSITAMPAITLTFGNNYSSGSLRVKGINNLCQSPGLASADFFINVHEPPSAIIRNVADSLNFNDSVCGRSRITYYTAGEYLNYRWRVHQGMITGDSLSRTVTVDWDSIPCTASVSVIVEDQQGCAGTTAKSLTITSGLAPKPSAIWLFGYNMLVCSDSTVSNYQWYLQNSPISGATGRYFLADTTSQKCYYVQTCTDACCNFSDPFCFVKSDAGPVRGPEKVFLGPNPAGDQLGIKVPGVKSHALQMEIYDLYGIRMQKEDLVTSYSMIDISPLPPGLYLVKLYRGQEVIYTSKLIKR